MDSKRTTYLMLGSAAALLVFAVLGPSGQSALQQAPPPGRPQVSLSQSTPKQKAEVSQAPRVEVVFTLDTTGSMSGLIEGAKKKVWELARFIAQGQPTPDLRIGLVAYRDIGDEYVTKSFDLSDDLDAVYQNLFSFTAAGGGDTPEHVAKALHDSVNRMSWSSGNNTLRIIYLVGDAPPHTDYTDGYDYLAIAQQAATRGIRINTIRCGADPDTLLAWAEVARRAHGEFTSIDQSGGMAEVVTPYDRELSELNRKLLSTAIGYGTVENQAAMYRKTAAAAAAPMAAQAERAGIFGLLQTKGKAAAISSDDLVDDVANNKADLKTLPAAALPKQMQGMSPEDKTRYLEEKGRERRAILDQINAFTGQRDVYLKKSRPASDDGFDGKIRASLKKQAADVGLAF